MATKYHIALACGHEYDVILGINTWTLAAPRIGENWVCGICRQWQFLRRAKKLDDAHRSPRRRRKVT